MSSDVQRTVLLTGATGQTGRAVLDHLLAAGSPVVALRHRSRLSIENDRLRWVDGDLVGLAPAFSGIQAGRMIHTTGLWLLPDRLAEVRAAGVTRLVAFGSTSVIGKRDSDSGYERRQRDALENAEARIRVEAERLGIDWTILRPTLTYGAGSDRNVSAAARFIARFGLYPVAGASDGGRQPVHVADLAAAAVRALTTPAAAGRVYDLAGGETLAYREMIGRIFDALERPRRLVRVPCLAAMAGLWGRVSGNPVLTADVVRRMSADLLFDDSAARQDLGYAPRRFLSAGRQDLGL